MSLKTFHVVFVAVCLLLAVSLAVGFVLRFSQSGSAVDLAYGVGWLIGGVALVVYARAFFRKLRRIGYS